MLELFGKNSHKLSILLSIQSWILEIHYEKMFSQAWRNISIKKFP